MARITAQLDSGTRVIITNGRHTWHADEPISGGGEDTAPTPYELLLGSLAACTVVTLQLYAQHKGIKLESIQTEYEFRRIHVEDCDDCDDDAKGVVERIEANVTIGGTFTDAERARIEQIVGRCPVHKTLTAGLKVTDHVTFAESLATVSAPEK